MDKIDKKYEEWKSIVDTESFLARYLRELMRVLEGVSEGAMNYEAAGRDCKGLVIGGCTNLLGRMTLDLRGINSSVFKFFMRKELDAISRWGQVAWSESKLRLFLTCMRKRAVRHLTGVTFPLQDEIVEKRIKQLISNGERNAEKLIMAAAGEATGLGREYYR